VVAREVGIKNWATRVIGNLPLATIKIKKREDTHVCGQTLVVALKWQTKIEVQQSSRHEAYDGIVGGQLSTVHWKHT
jgi:hypothetical protein